MAHSGIAQISCSFVGVLISHVKSSMQLLPSESYDISLKIVSSVPIRQPTRYKDLIVCSQLFT